MANRGLQTWRRIFTEVTSAVLGGVLFSKYASDENKKAMSYIGTFVGLAAAMGLNIFADDEIEKKASKAEKKEYPDLESRGIEYRADHVKRLKAETPSQSNSIQI